MECRQASSAHTRARSVQRDINNDARAPCLPCFPHTVYNMAVAACHLHDIPDTSDWSRARGAKPHRERRGELDPRGPPMRDRIGEYRDVRDTIEARRRARAKSPSPCPDQREGSLSQEHGQLATPSAEDYHLRTRAKGADDDFAVQCLSLLLSCSARAWLEQLHPQLGQPPVNLPRALSKSYTRPRKLMGSTHLQAEAGRGDPSLAAPRVPSE
jgi:hypothetical protein